MLPEHTGELLLAIGAMGNGVITTDVVLTGPIQPELEVAYTEYVPASVLVADEMIGFWLVLV